MRFYVIVLPQLLSRYYASQPYTFYRLQTILVLV
ncbi:hypothetical protein [Enterocloster phage PMBT24]|uniref:Uncharacterized protein n=1 Tax=Enterocloster phage PMBT24 TaxID=3025413 RepID=A0AAT9TRC4_9CAUD|nr:hypothetical protein [Enterocloster phage PMBT24]